MHQRACSQAFSTFINVTIGAALHITAPPSPVTPMLLPSSDTGISSSDGITRITTPTFKIDAPTGAIVRLYANGTQVGQATANNGPAFITTSALTQGTYQFTATVYTSPPAGVTQGASVTLTNRPADKAGQLYTVASFHTHTPTAYRPTGRGVGPSDADQRADRADNVVGLVYDYIGNADRDAPAGWPLNSLAKIYHSGPNQRALPST